MPPELGLLPGTLMYADNNGTMVPITEFVSLRTENDDGEPIMPYRVKLFPNDQELTATIKLVHYSPWKWNRVLGWKRHTILRPRKRVLIRLVKQGFTVKGKKVLT